MKTRHVASIALALAAAAAAQVAVAPRAQAAAPKACRNGYVSISYDDGPTASTPDLLKALRKADITATFFNTGAHAEEFPKYVLAESDAGHEIANHSYSHANFQTIGDDAAIAELKQSQRILAKGRVDEPEFYRPPYGATTPAIAERAKNRLGLTEVIWTVDTNDWDGRSTDEIMNTLATVEDGDFVLMHDGYPNTIAAVPKIAALLKAKGLCDGRIAKSKTPVQAWENLSFNATVKAWRS